MTLFKDRTINHTKPVYVFRNLNRGGYSIMQGGLVVAHADEVLLVDCTFVVRLAGRRKVIEQQRKNVHAFVKGTLNTSNKIPFMMRLSARAVHYNPYRFETFVDKVTYEPLHRATTVHLHQTGVDYV